VSKWKSERVATDGGWFRLTIPWKRPGWDSLAVAESVFKVAMHEWVHIKDYQAGKWSLPWSSASRGGRRPKHDSRPEELRAINGVDDAIERGAIQRYQDLIIALALAHESLTVLDAKDAHGPLNQATFPLVDPAGQHDRRVQA